MKETTFEGLGSRRDEFLRRLSRRMINKGFERILKDGPISHVFRWLDASDPWSFVGEFAKFADFDLGGYEHKFEFNKSGIRFRVGVSATPFDKNLTVTTSLIYKHTTLEYLGKFIFVTFIGLLVGHFIRASGQYVYFFPFLFILILILYGVFVKPVKDTEKLIDKIIIEVGKSMGSKPFSHQRREKSMNHNKNSLGCFVKSNLRDENIHGFFFHLPSKTGRMPRMRVLH